MLQQIFKPKRTTTNYIPMGPQSNAAVRCSSVWMMGQQPSAGFFLSEKPTQPSISLANLLLWQLDSIKVHCIQNQSMHSQSVSQVGKQAVTQSARCSSLWVYVLFDSVCVCVFLIFLTFLFNEKRENCNNNSKWQSSSGCCSC